MLKLLKLFLVDLNMKLVRLKSETSTLNTKNNSICQVSELW
jgi:hypothetical protein